MKSKLIFKIVTLLIVFSLCTATTYGQTGRIAGKVTDKKTGETLIGLTVKINGTTKGVSTDVEGRYLLSGLTAGKYILDFSYIGYAVKSISDVIVNNDQVTNLDVVMEESSGQKLNEVVITATARQESIGGLYAQQKTSVRISDGITADVIRRSPDRSTGEVLKRVSGTSIQDNKFVVVRGLSDRYNNTLMNGAPLPSSEPDRKAFSFDVVPSNLIDQVVINKTAAADLPGDFAGGVIQMKTKDFPDQRVLSFNYSTGYNTQSTFKPFKGSTRGNLDFLAMDNGHRDMPSSFPQTASKYVNSSLEQRFAYSKSFANSWGVNSFGSAAPTQSIQLNYGDTYKMPNQNKLGFLVSLNYRNASVQQEQRRADYQELSATANDYVFDYNDNVYNHNVSLGGLANVAYTFDKSKLTLKTLYNRVFEDTYTDRVGGSFEVPHFEQMNSQFQLTQKSLFNSSLEGAHSLGEKNFKLDWNLSLSASNQSLPDLRRLYYSRAAGTNEPFEAAVPAGSGSPRNAGRYFSDLQDYIYGGGANFVLPWQLGAGDQSIKIGFLSQYRTRDFNSRELGYIRQNPSAFNANLLRLPQDQLFAEQNFGPNGFVVDDITMPSNNYTANGFLNAAYIMSTNEVLQKLKLNWGVRVESYMEELESFTILGSPINVDNKYFDVLPSANLIYSPSDKTNLRFSYSNTVARAEFRELAPFSFFEFESQNMVIGNPDLERTRINNFDLRLEHYPSSGQVLSITTFYKDFTNPIERVFQPGSVAASKTASFQNAKGSTLYGVELEARQTLGFLGNARWLNNWTAYVNASLMKSDVKLDRVRFPNNNDSRALQGQSPYLINGGLQYSDKLWSFNALYNRIGRRINIVGIGGYDNEGKFVATYPDIYENPRDIVDLSISRKVLNSRAEIKLNVADIFNQESVLYQDVNGDKIYSRNDDQTNRRVKYGTTYNLSFGYSF